MVSWCTTNGHTYVETTTGITNRCVYCKRRAQWWWFGHMQI